MQEIKEAAQGILQQRLDNDQTPPTVTGNAALPQLVLPDTSTDSAKSDGAKVEAERLNQIGQPPVQALNLELPKRTSSDEDFLNPNKAINSTPEKVSRSQTATPAPKSPRSALKSPRPGRNLKRSTVSFGEAAPKPSVKNAASDKSDTKISKALSAFEELIKNENTIFTLLGDFLNNPHDKSKSDNSSAVSSGASTATLLDLITPRLGASANKPNESSEATNESGWDRLKKYLSNDVISKLEPSIKEFKKLLDHENPFKLIREFAPEKFYENINEFYTFICDDRYPFQKYFHSLMTVATVIYEEDLQIRVRAQKELKDVFAREDGIEQLSIADDLFISQHNLNALTEKDRRAERQKKWQQFAQDNLVKSEAFLALQLKNIKSLINVFITQERELKNVGERLTKFLPSLMGIATKAIEVLEKSISVLNPIMQMLSEVSGLEHASLFSPISFNIDRNASVKEIVDRLSDFIKILVNRIVAIENVIKNISSSQNNANPRLKQVFENNNEKFRLGKKMLQIADLAEQETRGLYALATNAYRPSDYLDSCFVKPVQRLPQYPMTSKELLLETVNECLDKKSNSDINEELQAIKKLFIELKAIDEDVGLTDAEKKARRNNIKLMPTLIKIAKALVEKRKLHMNSLLAKLRVVPHLQSEKFLSNIDLTLPANIAEDDPKEIGKYLFDLTGQINRKIDALDNIGKSYIGNVINESVTLALSPDKDEEFKKNDHLIRKMVDIIARALNHYFSSTEFQQLIATSSTLNADALKIKLKEIIVNILNEPEAQEYFKRYLQQEPDLIAKFQQRLADLDLAKAFQLGHLQHYKELNKILEVNKEQASLIKDAGIVSNLIQIFSVYKDFMEITEKAPQLQSPDERRNHENYTKKTTRGEIRPEWIEYYVRTLCFIDSCRYSLLENKLNENIIKNKQYKSILEQLNSELSFAEPVLSGLSTEIVRLMINRGKVDAHYRDKIANIISSAITQLNAPNSLMAKMLEALLAIDHGNEEGQKKCNVDHVNYLKCLLPQDLHFDKIEEKKSENDKQPVPDNNIQFNRIYKHVIANVLNLFAKFDHRINNELIKSAGDIEQDASFKIQTSLLQLLSLSTDELSCKLYELPPPTTITKLIAHTISKHLAVAGTIAECYLNGSFGETLNQVVKYLDSLVNVEHRANSITKMLIPNPFGRKKLQPTDNKKYELTKNGIIANIWRISDYYLKTPLGQKLAENATANNGGTTENQSSRGSAFVEELRSLALKMYIDKRDDQEVIKEALKIIYNYPNKIFNSLSHNPILLNEIKILVNQIIHAVKHHDNSHNYSDYPINNNRFPQNITQYNMDENEALKYIRLHLMQQYAMKFNYKNKINSRHVKTTSEHKILSMQQIEELFNDIFQGNNENIDALLKKLPPEQQNLSNFVAKELEDLVEPPFVRNPVLAEGEFKKAFAALLAIPKVNKNNSKQAVKNAQSSQIDVAVERFDGRRRSKKLKQSDEMSQFDVKTLSIRQLIAQLLYMADYYCDNELAQENLEELNDNKEDAEKIASNDKKGKAKYVQELAQFLAKVHLENQDPTLIKQDELRKEIIAKMQGIVTAIDSRRSRLANTLDTLIDSSHKHSRHLPDEIIKRRFFNDDDAANYIERHIIEQVKIPMRDYDEAMMRKWIKPAAKLEHRASFNLRKKLTELSKLNKEDRRKQIANARDGIRGGIISIFREQIVSSGRISACFRKGMFGSSLERVHDYLNKIYPIRATNSISAMFIKKNIESYYKVDVQQGDGHVAHNNNMKLAFLANIMIITDVYRNTFLGQQYVDDYNNAINAKDDSPLRLKYNDEKQAQAEKAAKLAKIAAKLYLDNSGKDDAEIIKEGIKEVLKVVTDIHGPQMAGGSRLANELYCLASQYAEVDQVVIPNNKRFAPDGSKIFNPYLNTDKAKNYIELHIIQNAAETLESYETEISERKYINTSRVKINVIENIRNRFDDLYNSTSVERESTFMKSNYNIAQYLFATMRNEIPHQESIYSKHTIFRKGSFATFFNKFANYIQFIKPKTQGIQSVVRNDSDSRPVLLSRNILHSNPNTAKI